MNKYHTNEENISYHISSLRDIDWDGYNAELRKTKSFNGDSSLKDEVEQEIRHFCPGKNFFFVNSGTAALELALMSLKLDEEDEVILPSFTFTSCANAIIRAGAKPVFANIDAKCLHLSLESVMQVFSAKTKCIMVVEYGGIRANLNEIYEFCKKHKLVLLLDSAQTFGTSQSKDNHSKLADFVCYSFHDTKVFSCGEGGLLIVNNLKYLNRAVIMFEKGTNRLEFIEGKTGKYSWKDIGSSFIMSNVNLLLLKFQIRIRVNILKKKYDAIEVYENFFGLSTSYFFVQRSDHSTCSNGHIYWLILPNTKNKKQLQNHLSAHGIETVSHYVPLHCSEFAKKSNFRHDKNMANTFAAGECLLRLPVISPNASKKVVKAIERFNA